MVFDIVLQVEGSRTVWPNNPEIKVVKLMATKKYNFTFPT